MITGPALDELEAEALASLMRDPNWKVYESLIGRMKEAAIVGLNTLDQSMELNGYWKGIISVLNDIEDLPKGIGQQLSTEKENMGDLSQ